MLTHMADALAQGETLAQALEPHARRFPTFFVEALAAGELSGTLGTELPQLADYYEEQLAIRRALIRGLVYPAMVLVSAIYLIPVLAYLLKAAVTGQSGAEVVDYLGRFTLSVAIQLGLFMAVVGFLARIGVLRWLQGIIAAYIWPFASLFQKFAMARFLHSLALLLDSGLGAIPSVQRAAAVTGIPAVQRDLLRAVPAIRQGVTLVQAFSQSRFLPRLAREMLEVGEQSGTLGVTLKKASEYLHQEGAHTLKTIARIEEGIAIIVIAILLFWR